VFIRWRNIEQRNVEWQHASSKQSRYLGQEHRYIIRVPLGKSRRTLAPTKKALT
jgi:hypothetical protein